MKLLFCSANPLNDLNLISELEAVLTQINAIEWHVDYLHEVTIDKLASKIRTFQPDIVHFCGHSSADELILVNPTNGAPQSLAPTTFGSILRAGKPLKAIVLNACENLAVFGDIRDSADWGIGTTRDVTDKECTSFTEFFYGRLSANKKDIPSAYRYALSRMGPQSKNVKFRILKLEPTWRRLRRLKSLLVALTAGVFFSLAGMLICVFLVNRRVTQSEQEIRSEMFTLGQRTIKVLHLQANLLGLRRNLLSMKRLIEAQPRYPSPGSYPEEMGRWRELNSLVVDSLRDVERQIEEADLTGMNPSNRVDDRILSIASAEERKLSRRTAP